MVNPQVNVGDRLVVLYMYDEIGVPIGTRGTVIKVSRDPFEPDGYIKIHQRAQPIHEKRSSRDSCSSQAPQT